MTIRDRIQTRKTGPESGFTIVELMVVIVIIAIIAGFTLGEINSAGYQLKSRAHTLKAHMMQAKLEAVKRDLRVRLTINTTNDGYSIDSINSSDNVVTNITTIRYANKFTFTGNNTTFSSRGTANSNSIALVAKSTTSPEYKVFVNNIGRVRFEKTKN